jgi:hypothetical protein
MCTVLIDYRFTTLLTVCISDKFGHGKEAFVEVMIYIGLCLY